jgi:hypothetical protein
MSDELPQSGGGTQLQESQSVESPRGGLIPEWLRFGGEPVDPTKRQVVSTDEVYALLDFAANNGVAMEKVEVLSQAIHEVDPNPSQVAARYADLVAETHPVTGHTLLDSRQWSVRRLVGISTATAVFFILAVGNYIVDNWVADIVQPEEGRLLFWLNVKRYAWDYLTPFFWGGLGACVFLLKKVQDAARENVYEHHLMQGWGTRVLIGGVLAAIVLIIFDPSTFTAESLPLRPAAIAFLTGLGVKAVYGGLERLIEEIAKRFSVKNIATQPAGRRGGESND